MGDIERILNTAEQCGLRDEITVVDSLSSPDFLRGRTPALQLSGVWQTVLFGVDVVCDYLETLCKPESKKKQKLEQEATCLLDPRSAEALLTCIMRDAVSRAFPRFYGENLPLDVKYDGRKLKNASVPIEYVFSSSQVLFNEFRKKHGTEAFPLTSPQQTAEEIAKFICVDDHACLGSVQVEGFRINMYLSPSYLNSRIDAYSTLYQRIPGPGPCLKKERIVVDFSSPNIAKEMHVGHLRSTIIGDSLCRLLEYASNQVLRVNHVGDWGTQFGMLLEYLKKKSLETSQDTLVMLENLTLSELNQLYRMSKEEFDRDEEFKQNSRKMVVNLQSGKDAYSRQVWEKLVEVSKQGFEGIYRKLNTSFHNSVDRSEGIGYCGESFYQKLIPETINSLASVTTKRGEAKLIFTNLPEAKQAKTEEHPDGEIPLWLQKSDGGFGYDSTDLAAIRYRCQELKANRIIYVTDAGQQLHFHMVFKVAENMQWLKPQSPHGPRAEHVKFGVVTGKGGGRLKSRSGQAVSLDSLLTSAKQKMKEIRLQRFEKGQAVGVSKEEQLRGDAESTVSMEHLDETLGFAAVKYFDLRSNRIKDYEYDEDLMCSPDGDTAVYLMFAFARVCSIIDKAAEIGLDDAKTGYDVQGASHKERTVAMTISRFHEEVEHCLATLQPHFLCTYLYQLTSELSALLTDDHERIWAKREATSTEALSLDASRGYRRLILVRAARSVIFQGLGLLGIVPPERM